MVPEKPFRSGPVFNNIGNALYYVGILIGTLVYGIILANVPFRFAGEEDDLGKKSPIRSKQAYTEQVQTNLDFLGIRGTPQNILVNFIFPIANIIAYIALFEFIGWVFVPELLHAAGLLLLAAAVELAKYVVDFYNVFVVPSVNTFFPGYLKEITFQAIVYIPSGKFVASLATGLAAFAAYTGVSGAYNKWFGPTKKENEPIILRYKETKEVEYIAPDYTKPSKPIDIPRPKSPPRINHDETQSPSTPSNKNSNNGPSLPSSGNDKNESLPFSFKSKR